MFLPTQQIAKADILLLALYWQVMILLTFNSKKLRSINFLYEEQHSILRLNITVFTDTESLSQIV